MVKGFFQLLIQKHLAGKTTREEEEFLEAYDRLFDNEPSFVRTNAAVGSEIYAGVKERIDAPAIRPARYRLVRYTAAAAAALLVIGWWTWSYHFKSTKENEKQTTSALSLIVLPGKVSSLTLPDGTEVVLSGGSRLTYPGQFAENVRMVRLEGQAYFKVARRIHHPFIVKTPHVDVRVLGTSFNLKSHGKRTEVLVETGTVAVKPAGRQDAVSELILHAAEKGIYEAGDQVMKKTTDDSEEIWQHGTLDIKNQSLAEIKPVLENRYRIKMEISPALLACKIFTKITDETAEETLSALAETINANLSIVEGGTYRLSGDGCTPANQ